MEAPAELCGAIRYVNRWDLADLIITGRGGGSLEDLWAFNDEMLARTIYESRIPVISAVGHEPDVTISDYVADLRAATPSNAAELAVPDREELIRQLRSMASAMGAHLAKQVKVNRQRLSTLAAARPLQSPTAYLDERRLLLTASSAASAPPSSRLWQKPPAVRPSDGGPGRHESPEGPDPGLRHGPDGGRPAPAPGGAGAFRRPVYFAAVRWPDSGVGGIHRTIGPLRRAKEVPMSEQNEQSQSFEQSMARLEQIVRAMERGDVPLEESLKLFEEGTALVRRCSGLLDGAELQIKQVMKGPDGAPVEMEFGSHE